MLSTSRLFSVTWASRTNTTSIIINIRVLSCRLFRLDPSLTEDGGGNYDSNHSYSANNSNDYPQHRTWDATSYRWWSRGSNVTPPTIHRDCTQIAIKLTKITYSAIHCHFSYLNDSQELANMYEKGFIRSRMLLAFEAMKLCSYFVLRSRNIG